MKITRIPLIIGKMKTIFWNMWRFFTGKPSISEELKQMRKDYESAVNDIRKLSVMAEESARMVEKAVKQLEEMEGELLVKNKEIERLRKLLRNATRGKRAKKEKKDGRSAGN